MGDTEERQIAVMQEGARHGHATWTKRKLQAAAREAQCGREWIKYGYERYPWYNLSYPEISQTNFFVLESQKIYQGYPDSKIFILGYPRDILN